MRMRKRLSNGGRHVALASCVLALGISFSACQDEYLVYEAGPDDDIYESIYGALESGNLGSCSNFLRLIADPDVNSGDSKEAQLTEILSKTGSKTLFTASDAGWQKFFEANARLPKSNPWHYAQSYEQLSPSQKKLLLHTCMLNNAITMENLASSSGDDPIIGQNLRRYSDIEVVDTVTRIAVTDLPKTYWSIDKQATEEGAASPEADQWSRIRNGGLLGYDSIYMVQDSSRSMMLCFTDEYLAKNQITNEDFRIIMGRSRTAGDVHIYDTYLDKADIICGNGYINRTEMPLVPLANMAEVIRSNGRTDIFSHLLDRFSVPFRNYTVGRLFARLNPDKFKETDTLYTKRYYSKRTFGSTKGGDLALRHDERGTLFANTGEAILKFDPGWNEYFPMGSNVEEDMGAMFVPNDAQMLHYFNEGGGKTLLEEYTKDRAGRYSKDDLETLFRDIDQIPLKVVQAIINHGMLTSFVSSVPSKMLKLREATTLEPLFKEADTKLLSEGGTIDTVMVACNGAVYIMNNVFAPSDFNCVATPAYIRSTNRIMRWAIYSDYDGSNYMGLNYYAYLKAMRSGFSFFLPNDEALKYYYDPMSFTSKNPRVMSFEYTSGNFPFAVKNSDKNTVIRLYNVTTGEIGIKSTTQSTNQTEIVNRLRQMLEHNTIVHASLNDTTINSDEDQYYLSKNGMGIKVTRENGGVVRAQGGFQLENEREGLEQINPGIRYCNVTTKGNYANGNTFTLDAPLIPAARSVFSVLSNIKRGDRGEPIDYENDETVASNPYYQFFRLCNEADWDLIVKCGLVNEKESKYDQTTSSGKNALKRAVEKYTTFVDNNAVDFNVQFFSNYYYTVFAPTNEAVLDAIAKGLPTWESIQEDFDNCEKNDQDELLNTEDSLRIQYKITYLTNFIRTHFADNTVFADKSAMGATEMSTNSYDYDKGVFVKAVVSRVKEGGDTMLKVMDNTGNGEWINTIYTIYTTDSERDVRNIMTCDRTCNSAVKNQMMLGKTTDATSYAVVHLINGVLNHLSLNEDGTYPDFGNTGEARKYIQRFAIR